MTSPRYDTHWEVSAHHPDRTEPHDSVVLFFPTEQEARRRARALSDDGWVHITVLPPVPQRGSRSPDKARTGLDYAWLERTLKAMGLPELRAVLRAAAVPTSPSYKTFRDNHARNMLRLEIRRKEDAQNDPNGARLDRLRRLHDRTARTKAANNGDPT